MSLPGIHYECVTATASDHDAVFDVVDDMLLGCRFGDVDELLNMVKLETLSIGIMLSYLTITKPFGYALPSRKIFFQRVKESITSRNPIDSTQLLMGLE
jgi:hypothetical protein